MDDLVAAALVKWPNVPNAHGWLGLDARGQWYLRDERVQAAGDFATSRGSLIEHARLIDFIGRNYAADAEGGWFFQNGPQRVYVDLEAAPWVWRLSLPAEPGAAPAVAAHTGQAARPASLWLDEAGRVYLDTDLGFGLVHSIDTAVAADVIESGAWAPSQIASASLAARFGFRLRPRP
ncbi:MAG: DUF2946 family protein [Burkholderiaceae bacterium]